MGRARSLVVIVMLAWVTTGCEQPSLPDDAGGSEMDAGRSEEAGANDAALDAPPPLDAGGEPDAAPVDPDAGLDAGGEPDAAPGDRDAGLDGGGCSCDDGIACTRDTCGAGGACEHTPVHVDCGAGQYCDATSGCRAGAICATTADCVRPDVCVTVECSTATRLCVYSPLDGDADGYPPIVCGGDDCDDGNAAVRPDVVELCDGVDSDCSGGPEPVDASPCRNGFVCGATACECPAPSSVCGSGFGNTCTDLATDERNCGGCGARCGTGQVCVAGACTCTTGTLCLSHAVFPPALACVDVSTDRFNCGACGTYCGEATCDSGSCACAPGETYCTAVRRDCAVLSTDPRHCGACDDRCPILAACDGGACDVTGTSARGYGAVGANSAEEPVVYASLDAATDAKYVAALVTAPGELHEMTAPIGPALGTSGRTHVVKLDAAGNIVWHLTSLDLVPRGIASDADRVWVIGTFVAATATLGPSIISRGGWTGASVALIELDAATGTLLASRTVRARFASGNGPYFAAARGGEVVFTGLSNAGANFGGAPLSAQGTFVARYTPGLVHVSSLLHYASPAGLQLSASGEAVSFGAVEGTGEIFGTTVISRPASWVASWASDTTLTSVFAAQPIATAIEPVAGGVWVAAETEPSLQLWSVSGGTATPSTATPAGWSSAAWDARNLRAYGGDLYADAILNAAGTIDGHAVPAGQTFVVRIDATTLAVERIAAITASTGTLYTRWVSALEPRGLGRVDVAGLLRSELRIGNVVLTPVPYHEAFFVAELAMTP